MSATTRRCYSAAVEGATSSYETRGGTPGDFDHILGVAKARSLMTRDSIVIRYIEGDEARIICTVTDGEVIYPRLATPPRPASEILGK